MKENSNLFMLQEKTGISDIEILSESSATKGASREGAVKFRATLQTMNSINSNGRNYLSEAMKPAVYNFNQSLNKKRYKFGELDHPVTDDPIVFTSVLLKNASHRILNLYTEGEFIKGDIITLHTTHGQNLYNLIEKDNLDIGFSVRALGRTHKDGNGRTIVGSNVRIITYDAVSSPSDNNAYLSDRLTEADVSKLILDKSEKIKHLQEAFNIDLVELMEDSNNQLDKIRYNHLNNTVSMCFENKCVTTLLEDYIFDEFKNSFSSLLK